MATTITAAELRRLIEIDRRIEKLRAREGELGAAVARVSRERLDTKKELDRLVDERDLLAQCQLILVPRAG